MDSSQRLKSRTRSLHDSMSSDDEICSDLPTQGDAMRNRRHHRSTYELPKQSSGSIHFDPYTEIERYNGKEGKISSGLNNTCADTGSNQLGLNERNSNMHHDGQGDNSQATNKQPQHMSTPGIGGFLEIEEEPPRYGLNSNPSMGLHPSQNCQQDQEQDLLGIGEEPIRTTSGLLLTHRRTPTVSRRQQDNPGPQRRKEWLPSMHSLNFSASRASDFETETGYDVRGMSRLPRRHSGLAKARRLLAFARLWVVVFCAFLVVGTGVAIRSFMHEGIGKNSNNKSDAHVESGSITNTDSSLSNGQEEYSVMEKVILLPLNNISELKSVPNQPLTLKEPSDQQQHTARRALQHLRTEFEDWIKKHEKKYSSEDEKESRFEIWLTNHHRTVVKNKKHGNCKLTKAPVFGSNHFKDLTSEEFQASFLTGYKGPTTDKLEPKNQRGQAQNKDASHVRQTPEGSGQVLDPLASVERHPEMQKLILAGTNLGSSNSAQTGRNAPLYTSSPNCSWYDMSCYVKWFFNTYGYGIIGTMEPAYDADTFPSSVDWRDYGVVSDVHSQGNCGACWAITAVETVESTYAISSGNLYDLAETEVISCDDTCEMCNGGWPQNAYDYVIENDGLPLEKDLSYDGDFLLKMTYTVSGTSQEFSQEYVETYMGAVCPNGNGGSGSGSGDQDDDGSASARYGKVKGYGYSTERCLCYTDGTGCDCDEQNEAVAIANVATYGPATVCVEASLWQDYGGGIMTSSVGCSSGFLDMNHCVQAVGYAFYDTNTDGEGGGGEDGSGSGSSDGGSQDDSNREGYWIIRNQWSSSWGMNGYAYVAMGENTCGVLNDMTQVYT